MEDPLAVQCNLVGNPLHEEQLEIVRRLGDCYALNTVIDEDRDLVHVTFGEVIESHMAAVEFVTASTRIGMDRRYKTIVTFSAGYPLDKTYYQTVKGMVTPLDILEPGGTLIIASSCSEGFGSANSGRRRHVWSQSGPEHFLATLTAKSLAEIDEWQTEMQMKAMRLGRVELYTTGLDDEERRITGVTVAPMFDLALRDAIARHKDPNVAFIPEGPYVVPVFAGGSSGNRLDAVGGIAGDMFAAAMVDALPDLRARVLADAAAVLPLEPAPRSLRPAPALACTACASGFRLQSGDHHHRHHAHAVFRDMVARIEAAPLSSGTAAHATAILRHLAEAEAAIHHVPVNEVHFHEIRATGIR